MVALLGRMDSALQRAGAFGRMRYIRPVRYSESSGTVRAVYDQILAEYGLGGPFFVTSVSPPLLAATWNLVRRSLLWGPLPRGQCEGIAAAVAAAESCPFCVDVHSELASAAGERVTAARVAQSDWQGLAAGATDGDRLAAWAPAFIRGEGPTFPLDAELEPCARSVALTFVLITSMVTVFQDDGLVAGSGGVRPVDHMMKLYMRFSLGRRMMHRDRDSHTAPGIDDRPADEQGRRFSPEDASLASAWSALGRAIDASGQTVLSQETREVVDTSLALRTGTGAGLDLRFLDEALEAVSRSERGAARLAIVAGLAPYRVTKVDLDRSGPAGERGERWVIIVALGVWSRLKAMATN